MLWSLIRPDQESNPGLPFQQQTRYQVHIGPLTDDRGQITRFATESVDLFSFFQLREENQELRDENLCVRCESLKYRENNVTLRDDNDRLRAKNEDMLNDNKTIIKENLELRSKLDELKILINAQLVMLTNGPKIRESEAALEDKRNENERR